MIGILRSLRARLRLFCGIAAGLVVLPFLWSGLPGPTRGIIAWDVGVLVYLVLSAALFMTEPVDNMAAHAKAQQEGEWTIFGITLGVVIVSFVAVTGEFSRLRSFGPEARGLELGLIATTLLVSWLMTHVSFAYRYAHEFYSRQSETADFDGGLEFPQETRPDYMDFFYFALVLGMTFQVSDVQITSRKLRRVALLHGLLSFLFNATIIALTVNLAAGMLAP